MICLSRSNNSFCFVALTSIYFCIFPLRVPVTNHGYLIPSYLQGCSQACPVETDGQDHWNQTNPSPSNNSHCTFALRGHSQAILSPANDPTSVNSWTTLRRGNVIWLGFYFSDLNKRENKNHYVCFASTFGNLF